MGVCGKDGALESGKVSVFGRLGHLKEVAASDVAHREDFGDARLEDAGRVTGNETFTRDLHPPVTANARSVRHMDLIEDQDPSGRLVLLVSYDPFDSSPGAGAGC